MVVPKRQRRLEGRGDAQVLALHAHGLTTRDIPGHLAELDGAEVSPTLSAARMDTVLEEVRLWQSRPLARISPILSVECLFEKSRQDGAVVKTKAVSEALGVNLSGEKESLGLGISETEGQRLGWPCLLTLRQRGVQEWGVVGVDGLAGLPEAVATGVPQTPVQLGLVLTVRHSLRDGVWKDRRVVAGDFRGIERSMEPPLWSKRKKALEPFALAWHPVYPTMSTKWRRDWERLTGFI